MTAQVETARVWTSVTASADLQPMDDSPDEYGDRMSGPTTNAMSVTTIGATCDSARPAPASVDSWSSWRFYLICGCFYRRFGRRPRHSAEAIQSQGPLSRPGPVHAACSTPGTPCGPCRTRRASCGTRRASTPSSTCSPCSRRTGRSCACDSPPESAYHRTAPPQ